MRDPRQPVLPEPWRGVPTTPVAGEMVAQAARLELPDGPAFLKWKDDAAPGAFAAEAGGLAALDRAVPGAAPRVRETGATWLLLEWIEPARGGPTGADERALAELLAAVHAVTSPDGAFGYGETTWLGRLAQDNTPCATWKELYVERRVRPQLDVARSGSLLGDEDLALIDEAAGVAAAACPIEPPTLVHGDLWSGNWMVAVDGRVLLVDPAVHFAHRELDLAFLALWGRVGPAFWERYDELAPIAPGFERRAPGLQLYHLVVHVNHYGEGYVAPTLAAARSVLRRA